MITLKKPVTKVNFGKVFWKAVKGNKNLQKKAAEAGVPTPFPLEIMQTILPYLKIEEVKKVPEKPLGISITEPIGPVRIKEPEVDLREINIVYPLIPSGGDVPFAASNIKWSKRDSSLIYYVIEPVLLAVETDLLDKIKMTLIEKLDIDFTTLRKDEARSYLKKRFEETVNIMAINLPENKRQQILYYIERDFVGLGKIEPLMKDPNIEDISCDGVGIPIFIYHRNPILGSIKTNIAFNTATELDIFVNKLAQRCGKNISIAQPLIGGTLPDGSRLQSTLGTDIARKGSNFSIRKFTERPLTPVHLLRFKTFDPKIAAFLWLAVEYGRSILITGGVATGKTTLLNALSLFIKPELKVVSIEDSVTEDCKIMINRNGNFEKTTIGKLVDEQIKKYDSIKIFDKEICRSNHENISVFSMNSNGKMILTPVSSFIRHKTKKDIFEIQTRTGRKIKVTGDHSLFSINEKGNIAPIETRKLRIGSFIAVPRYLPFDANGLECINVLAFFNKLNNYFLCGEPIKNIPVELLRKTSASNFQIKNAKIGVIPSRVFNEILNFEYRFDENDIKQLKIKPRNGRLIPSKLVLTENFLTIVGLWLADGCYDKNSVIFSVDDEESRNIVKNFANELSITTKWHSDKVSLMINSSALKHVMLEALNLRGNAYTKEIPDWIYNLNNKQLGYVLKGYFSGDGHVSKHEIEAASSSIELLKGIQTLLLRFGIISRIGKFSPRDKTYKLRISSAEMLKRFSENIGFLQLYKSENLKERCQKVSNHDCSDIIPFSIMFLKELKNVLTNSRINYNVNFGRRMLTKLIEKCSEEEIINKISLLINSDIFWDQIKEIKHLTSEDYVYDLSVPENENFVCENIIAHNTAELLLPHPHWVPSVARLPIAEIEGKKLGEVDLFDLLRESLRQRPDYLIVGEVRGREAYVLFQQIATGHSSMSTIHADSIERLVDRITTPPINLPANLIEALDLIVFLVRIKYGSAYIRRINTIYEVLGFDREKNFPIINEIFKWKASNDSFEAVNPSIVLKKISQQYGISENVLQKELSNRIKVLNWMCDNSIEDYLDVSKVIKLFYSNPEDVLNVI